MTFSAAARAPIGTPEEFADFKSKLSHVRYWHAIKEKSLPPAGLGFVCGVVGCMLDWALSSWGLVAPRAGPRSLLFIAAVIGFVTLAGWVLGAAYGCVTLFLMRRAAKGLLSLDWPAGFEERPVWWARALRDALVVLALELVLGCLWFLTQWFGKGDAFLVGPHWAQAPFVVEMALFIPIWSALGLLVIDGVSWVYRYFKPGPTSSRVVWFISALFDGVAVSVCVGGVMAAAAFLLDPVCLRLGLGSPWTVAAAIGSSPLVMTSGWLAGTLTWQGRPGRDGALQASPLAAHQDFRLCAIEPETSKIGLQANGFPYLAWRESADNRLGLSRSRYCRVAERDGTLVFEFFNPSEDARASGGSVVACVVAALVSVALLGNYWLTPKSTLPYAFNMTTPPVLMFLQTAFNAALYGSVIGGVWHLVVTLMRWNKDRFEGDGKIVSMPWRQLVSFTTVSAGEVGVLVNGEPAKNGHALVATFEDETMMVLTGNSWNYRSIVALHREFSHTFIATRESLMRPWLQAQQQSVRAAARAAAEPALSHAAAGGPDGVPAAL